MSRLQRKPGRKSNYVRSLDNPQWREVCRLVRLRDGHQCQRCRKAYSLEIHHLKYYINGQSIVGHESEHLDCLVTLCAECHQLEHNKINDARRKHTNKSNSRMGS